MVVDYKFDLDQKIETCFGTIGVIDMLGFNESGKLYYVKTATNSDWLKEQDLKETDK